MREMAAILSGIYDVPVSRPIINIARFAVEDYNKTQNASLKFGKVVRAKQQVVAGTMYYITLEATDGDKKKVYDTKIWEKPWKNFKKVREFKLVGDIAPSSFFWGLSLPQKRAP